RQLTTSSLNRQQAYYKPCLSELQGVWPAIFYFFSAFFEFVFPANHDSPRFPRLPANTRPLVCPSFSMKPLTSRAKNPAFIFRSAKSLHFKALRRHL
ncbi:MAG: hypothetical protein ACI4O7_02570, partial [Aristaeellaceae bacterium]